jgi:hypothetical protein
VEFHWGGIDDKQVRLLSKTYSECISTLFGQLLFTPSHHVEETEEWTTTFELPTHTTARLPGTPDDIQRFLAASLPFMTNLQEITVTFDSHILVQLTRSMGSAEEAPIPKSLSAATSHGLMAVSKVQKTNVHIKAESRAHDGSHELRSAGKNMLVWSADIRVTLEEASELGMGLNKATKKAVPDTCSFQLIYVSLLESRE